MYFDTFYINNAIEGIKRKTKNIFIENQMFLNYYLIIKNVIFYLILISTNGITKNERKCYRI